MSRNEFRWWEQLVGFFLSQVCFSVMPGRYGAFVVDEGVFLKHLIVETVSITSRLIRENGWDLTFEMEI